MPRTRLVIDLDLGVLQALRDEARERGLSESQIVERLVREHLGFGVLDELGAGASETSDEQALRLASEEVRAHREAHSEQRRRGRGHS